MVYDIINRLLQSDSLRDKTLILKDKTIVTGGTIFDLTRSEIKYLGGESNMEEFTIPLEEIKEIRRNHHIIFKRKKRIDKIYPRG
jgi:hypothetical protein